MAARNGLFGSLLGAFIGDTTPTQDPRFLDSSIQVDPETANLVDATGQPIKDQSAVLPYKQPSFGTKMFHPEVANQEADFNNAYQLAPAMAQRQNLIGRDVSGYNYSQLPDQLKAPGLSVPQAISAGYGNARSPGQFGEMNRELGDINQGLTGTQIGTDIASANRMLAMAKGGEATAPIDVATEKAQAVNRLHQATGLDPVVLDTEISKAIAEKGRLPTDTETQQMLSNLRYRQAKVEGTLQGTREQLVPFQQTMMRNEAAKGAFESNYFPPMGYPVGMRITPEGNVSPFERTPGFVNEKMAGIQALTNPGGAPAGVRLPGGGALPMRSLSPFTGEPIQPIGHGSGTNTVTNPNLGSNTNGVPIAPVSKMNMPERSPIQSLQDIVNDPNSSKEDRDNARLRLESIRRQSALTGTIDFPQ